MSRRFDGTWVPCKKRLPEESGKYLVQMAWGGITDCYFSKKHQQWNAHDCTTPKYALKVVAWMYMPPKYEGEGCK